MRLKRYLSKSNPIILILSLGLFFNFHAINVLYASSSTEYSDGSYSTTTTTPSGFITDYSNGTFAQGTRTPSGYIVDYSDGSFANVTNTPSGHLIDYSNGHFAQATSVPSGYQVNYADGSFADVRNATYTAPNPVIHAGSNSSPITYRTSSNRPLVDPYQAFQVGQQIGRARVAENQAKAQLYAVGIMAAASLLSSLFEGANTQQAATANDLEPVWDGNRWITQDRRWYWDGSQWVSNQRIQHQVQQQAVAKPRRGTVVQPKNKKSPAEVERDRLSALRSQSLKSGVTTGYSSGHNREYDRWKQYIEDAGTEDVAVERRNEFNDWLSRQRAVY